MNGGKRNMKSVRYFDVGQYRRVLAIEPRSADPERTKKAIMEALDLSEDQVFAREDFDQLVEQYAVFSEPVPGEVVFEDDDSELASLELKFKALTEHQFLDLSGEVVPDWRGTKYHLKTDGLWAEVEIKDVGIAVPGGAVFPDKLTEEQRKEISDQKEAARVAALSPEAREAELKARLESLADEADHLERRAKIQGEDFDAAAWYQEHKAPVEEKYAS
jgi:hypothetical protein